MKASIWSAIFAVIIGAGLSGCATSSSYDAKIETWKGVNADILTQAWGQPDAIEPLHTGNKMYVYARLKRLPIAYADFQKKVAANTGGNKLNRNPASVVSSVYIRCATYFEVDRQNVVDSVLFRGDDCK